MQLLEGSDFMLANRTEKFVSLRKLLTLEETSDAVHELQIMSLDYRQAEHKALLERRTFRSVAALEHALGMEIEYFFDPAMIRQLNSGRLSIRLVGSLLGHIGLGSLQFRVLV